MSEEKVMNEYRVTANSVNIASGILELNKDQAESRQHCLVDLGEGLYEVAAPVQFKRGEVFGYDGEVNKALLQDLEELAAEEEAAAKKAEEEAAAKKAEEEAAAKKAEEKKK